MTTASATGQTTDVNMTSSGMKRGEQSKYLSIRVSILSRRLMPPHVICVGGACILYIGSKGNSTCNSSSLLTLGLSMVQRRQMEALSRGISKL